MVTVRAFAAGDETSLVHAWNLGMPSDPTTPGWFRDCVLLDPNFDPEGLRVAVSDGRVVGCAYAVRRLAPLAPGTDLEPDTGWIPFFFVVPEHRGKGLGRRLVGEALAFLENTGRTKVDFSSYTPNYVLPGADAELYPDGYRLLTGLGFQTLYSPVAMDRTLVGYATPDEVHELRGRREREGYAFRSPTVGELPELIRFAADAFNPDWGEAIRQHRDPARIVIAKKERIVGFALYAAYRGIPERFGPFGVDPDLRGTGLGKILLHLTMTMMRAEGLHSSWFLWTGETSPAGHLYTKAGYEITRRFHVMRRVSA
ncbi:GNAT family N-acetyltransferase [Nonomuraea phyllanthi]|uniref:GNAT family N-acetyltransferase n=1 Tax=Nonomuraea phyllanthi TaxID=2219224 RepID=A0A5C4VMP9_9ACTN|nr:GNAT family N-acetyltransferase [Nonomuraea phyllanthi]KAB8189321.1 GNAT family N-acetyltransferase [Nonomuraea phyllanthi]QFY11767.1 GNAT family N-acetyltransferase [Nonomuraea phyllanthi]